jgi:hypothetical protein
MARQPRIEPVAVYCRTGVSASERGLFLSRTGAQPPWHGAEQAMAMLGIRFMVLDVRPGYLEMLLNPQHGYGANVNPCLDCHIFMINRVREELMEKLGARFVFTGEVLGQRPMSQRRDTLPVVDRRTNLQGRILRPLSAKLLTPTIPEHEGLVDRELLYGISGRSRKEQMTLAAELGITEYPQPAGGSCFLTDESFAERFNDLMGHRAERAIEYDEVHLLAIGRHLRLGERLKLIIGRDQPENDYLETHAGGRVMLQAKDLPGATVLLEGPANEAELRAAAAVTARYGKGRDLPVVSVEVRTQGGLHVFAVTPASDAECDRYRIS